jgi:predicted RNA-binding protein YlxR (DUF448 family)
MPTDMLVRLVVDPDGKLVADVAAKLPGRGVWIKADGPLIRSEIKSGRLMKAASRSLKMSLKKEAVSLDLAETITSLLTKRCLDRLGLEQRAGNLITGFDKIKAALAKKGSGEPDLVFAASDGAEDGRRKIRSIVGASVSVVDLFDRDQLSMALGKENAVHVLLLKSGGTEKLKVDIGRLVGLSATSKTE